MENSIGEVLIAIVQWIIIPGIIIYFFYFSIKIYKSIKDNTNRISARSGILAGLVIFVIYFISQSKNSMLLINRINQFPKFQILPFLIGIMFGIGLLLLLNIIISSSFIGVITLIFSSISSVGLFSYFFLNNLRAPTLFFILGLALGNLLFSIVKPETLKDVFNFD